MFECIGKNDQTEMGRNIITLYYIGWDIDTLIVMPNHLHAILFLSEEKIREYILNNPKQGELDQDNPKNALTLKRISANL